MPCTLLDLHAETVHFNCTSICDLCYVGHGSVVGPGCNVESMAAIGDLAILAPRATVPSMSMVLGENRVITRPVAAIDLDSPPIPRRFHPLRLLLSVYMLFVITAGMWAGFEILFELLSDVGTLDGLGVFDPHKFFGWQPAQFCFVWRSVVGMAMLGVFGAMSLLHKWVLLGRMAAGAHNDSHNIASSFFFVYGLFNACWIFLGSILQPFVGTPITSLVFNLMGVKVVSAYYPSTHSCADRWAKT